MSSTNRWILSTNNNGVSPTGFNKNDSATMLRKCEDLLGRSAQGACTANLQLALNPVAALATLTFAGNTSNADTLLVGNLTITFVTSGAAASSKQINLGTAGDGTDVAVSVAALINGTANTRGFIGTSAAFNGICTASVSGAVVTLTAAIPGTVGNGLQLSKSCANLTLTHAWGAATAGTEGTAATFKMGQ
jgi:hypothetical protein